MEVVRKDIKNLHVGVYPPEGRIRVAAPLHLDDDALRMAVISRLAWIRRKQSEFEQPESVRFQSMSTRHSQRVSTLVISSC